MRKLCLTTKLCLTIGGLATAATLALAPAAAQASPAANARASATAGSTWTASAGSSWGLTSRAAGLQGKINASAEPASNTYAKGYAVICNDLACSKWSDEVDYAVTYNGTNVWINGEPKCTPKGTSKTWCGYGDNGQKTIGIGDNFGTTGQWQLRIYVHGDGSCDLSWTLGVLAGAFCA